MKSYREWVIAVLLFSGLSTWAQDVNDPAPASTNLMGADAIWAGMYEQGMITDEQYAYVQENGHMPGGTTVSNSPVTEVILLFRMITRLIMLSRW